MNNYLDKIIKTRRSIRSFTDKKVSNKTIRKIIEAGIRAPSGGNYQPWYFIVVQDKKIIDKMNQVINKKHGIEKHNYRHFLFNAKTIISVCVDMSYTYLNSRCFGDIDRALDSIEIISTGACIQNMLLKINELGLGACWCRVSCFFRREQEKLLNIKYPRFLVAIIPLGYPAEKGKRTPRKNFNEVCKII